MSEQPQRGKYENLRLMVVDFNGEFRCWVAIYPGSNGRMLQKAVAQEVNERAETFALCFGSKLVCSSLAIGDQDIPDSDCVTMTRLVQPAQHDGGQECDSCGHQRYCHFGWSWAHGDPEPVIALCDACGGKHYDPNEASDWGVVR